MSNDSNIDAATVSSFGDEWTRFDQATLATSELKDIFNSYFHIFPWERIPGNAEGFDMGCGSGRWARLVSTRVSHLNCIDASEQALAVARSTLVDARNITFIHASVNDAPLPANSQDFGYSLGVLHHVPDTERALAACVELLKPGAPLLIYLYYRFDNRPAWFQMLWRGSELLRGTISKLPSPAKRVVTDLIALVVYWPLARFSAFAERLGLLTDNFPLRFYRNVSFYTMRTDSRDRFGTPLEQRFTKNEIEKMMRRVGLENIVFSDHEPFWVAMGIKTS